MKSICGYIIFLSVAVSGCTTFEENLKSDEQVTSIQNLNREQEATVNEFSDSGQINAYEKAAMEQSIAGGN